MNVIIANHLADGFVVFQTRNGWTHDLDEAELLDGKEAGASALERAGWAAAENVVVDPTLIEVTRDGARLVPVKLRERIRAEGPTTGNSKQAASVARDRAA